MLSIAHNLRCLSSYMRLSDFLVLIFLSTCIGLNPGIKQCGATLPEDNTNQLLLEAAIAT